MVNHTVVLVLCLVATMGLFALYDVNRAQIVDPVKQNVRVVGCDNFDGINACQGSQTDNAADWENRNFQTPQRYDPGWRDSYQDYNLLQGYVQYKYSYGMSQVKLIVQTRVNPKVSTGKLVYVFDGVEQDSNTKVVDLGYKQIMTVKVKLLNGVKTIATLQLEPIDFYWNHPTINQGAEYKNGQKGAIVEMFGWPYKDIALECETLGKSGWMGVKVYPPSESILDYEHPENGELNPWYWLYQPVSYKLVSRMGTVEDLRQMINTCRKNNVRVYADAVVNHMAGNGNDMYQNHCSGNTFWGSKNSSGGSPFWSQGYAYQNSPVTGQKPGMEFPAVPYGPNDFHCARSLNSWTDGFIMNYGWLVNLSDLNTETDYVRQRIADYITELISMGISGIRIDAAKHISPKNLAAIFAKLKVNLGGALTPDFTTYLEVILGGEGQMLMCNDNDYNYGKSFENQMKSAGLSDDDIYKIKIWSSDYPKEHPICGYWAIPSERTVIQLDCHDDQNPGSSSRDMQDKGTVLVKSKDVNLHREFEKQLFTRTDGNWQIRLVMSSYSFVKDAQGPPDGHSDCAKCTGSACNTCTKSVPFTPAHDANACGYSVLVNGQWQEGKYTRVHRDKQIIDAMRGWMGLKIGSATEYGLPANC